MAERIGVPISGWPGNCYAVASSMVRTKLARGVEAYGHYYGPVRPGSMFHERHSRLGWSKHGWVRLADGRILDPTRWVFLDATPSIAVIARSDPRFEEYDEGGNRWRSTMLDAPPPFDPKPSDEYPKNSVVALKLSLAALSRVLTLLGTKSGFSTNQRAWLAMLPPAMLGEHAREVYGALKEVGDQQFVPIDNWRMVMEKKVRRR